MNVPYSWLKELVDFSWSPEELANRLTLAGAETEAERLTDIPFDNIVIGRVEEISKVPGSDHLTLATVFDGREKLAVVCGAPNVAAGQNIILAKIGAELKGGFKIKKAKLRGVESFGMICSERELGISDDHSGIMVLEDSFSLGAPAFEAIGLDDHVLSLDLTPNRADLLSVMGVARDVACLAGSKIKYPTYMLEEVRDEAAKFIKIDIADPEACPRYAARVIRNIKIGPSPWWIKRKLLLCGIRPINNVVDITNLVMMEIGHPLHAFDYDRFLRKEILVRRAQEGEKFATLDGKEHVLTPEVLLITDGEKGVACGGVMGGQESEVSDKTTTVLLESAYFNAPTVRRSRQKLGLITEASIRFEKGCDPNAVEKALDRAAYLLGEYTGGEILNGVVDCYPNKKYPVVIKVRPERVNAVLGTDIPKSRMVEILQNIEYGIKDRGHLEVTVPTFAVDVTREIDVIEEIVRLEGYDAVPTRDKNKGPLFSPYPEDEQFCDNIRRILTAQGYDEIYSGGMADKKLLEQVSGAQPAVEILNPIADDLTVMENTILFTLLKSAGHNIAHRNVDLKLFVIGKIYKPGAPPLEEEEIGILVTGKGEDTWYNRGASLGFHDLKGAVEAFLGWNRITVKGYEPAARPALDAAESMAILGADGELGYIGAVGENIARLFDVKQKLWVAVISFNKARRGIGPVKPYQPLPKYPAAPRDLAVVVDEKVRAGELLDKISKEGGSLLESVSIFDLFRGKQIGDGKKSLAFSMVYRSPERSLEAEEVNALHQKIAESLKEGFGADIREA